MIERAHSLTIERLRGIEGTNAYCTLIMETGYVSFQSAYLNYVMGCFEGILFTQFLDKRDRMTNQEENDYIKKASNDKFDEIKKEVTDLADSIYAQYEKGTARVNKIKISSRLKGA